MKFLLIFSILFASALGLSNSVNKQYGLPNFDMDQELSPEDLKRLEKLLIKELEFVEHKKLNDVNINVLMNDYLDKILDNVRTLIIDNGFDPTSIPDLLNINFGIGHTDLTEGQLNDTSTLTRFENATLSYDNVSKQLIADMLLRFEDLKFIYHYHTMVTFISMTGHLHGDIEHVHINIRLGIDFAQYKVFVDTINFKHTGEIKLRFSGNAAIDWITNAMSWVLTGMLHDLILNIVKNIIADPINSVVEAINRIFHPEWFI